MKHNILGCVEPLADYIQSLNLEHVDLVKTIPDFNFLLDKKMHVSDSVVYVYPNGSQTVSQRKTESKQRIAVGIAMTGKMHNPEALAFYDRVGETVTELKRLLIDFEPHNERYATRFFNQQLDSDDRHIFNGNYYFLAIRMTYDAILNHRA